MARLRILAICFCFPCGTGLSQSAADPTGTASFSGSLVFPADAHTRTAGGGSLDLAYLVSTGFWVGVGVGHWSGGDDFMKDSTETYVDAVLTHAWGDGKIRPFVQLGGGLYFTKFQFTSRNRFANGDSESVGGGFAGAGVGYRLSNNSAFEGRVRYHLVSDVSGVHTDFLESQLGYRVFF